MNRDYKLFIEDIKKSIEQIEKYVRDISEEGFKRDLKIQDAVIRRLEIIGEATKNIPKEIKEKYPKIRWQEIVGIRDFLSHVYFGVNIDRVWNIIKKDMPILNEDIKKLRGIND